MFTSSEDALECRETISFDAARTELARHQCRILATDCDTRRRPQIRVTNDHDAAEWIDCSPAAIMAWLGY